jgi:mannan polymerase II complex ANP1 subunit
MAKRMKFSVVGLPHYTIWHLYEPSVDDIRHMEEMEKERKEKEAKEKAEKDRMDKIKSQFDNPAGQWDKDKSDIRELAKNEYVNDEKDSDAKKAAKILDKTQITGPGEIKVESKGGKARIIDPLDEIKVVGQ